MTSEEIRQLLTGSFPTPCGNPELKETHISWVILCDDTVFKIKKPLKYSFLDFSTLAQRRHYCEREVLLNNRLTRNVYIDVVPIRKASSGISINGDQGEVVDYAVRMRKLDNDRRMDVLLRSGQVTEDHIHSLAKQIVSFHKKAEIVYPTDPLDIRRKFNDIEGQRDFIRKELGDKYSSMLDDALARSDEFVLSSKRLLEDRIEDGFHRDGHGDLHSRNIFLLDEPVIFDCIEFNDEYRQVDVLNEVAFLCMDLDAFERSDLSRMFMEDYTLQFSAISGTRDVALFNYYKCYRANVRAKVNCLRARDAAESTAASHALREAARYLELMHRYTKGFS
jgi:aminoglycoside phosphotransferase family enzyme